MTMPDDPHDQAEELLPWYATGQLEPADRMLVESHLSSCARCQRQLGVERRLIEEFHSFDPQIDSGWAVMRARVARQAGRPSRIRSAIRGFWALLRRPAVATLAVAQLAFVVIAGTILLSLSRPEYQALSSASATPPANIIVMFRADATEQDIRELLKASGASLAGGPTSADAYLLEVPANRRTAALARLQADDDVQMAEPIDGAAQ
jgi:anti-sigma factor RsiW